MVAHAFPALYILCFTLVFLPNQVPSILMSSLPSDPKTKFSTLSTFLKLSQNFLIIFFPSVISSCVPTTVVPSTNNDISYRVLLESELKLFFKCLVGNECPVIYRHPTQTSRSLPLASSYFCLSAILITT